jgi:hypothetical protein
LVFSILSRPLTDYFSFSNIAPPEKDEANAGNRDPLLEDTYKNLPNLRYVRVALYLYIVNNTPTISERPL